MKSAVRPGGRVAMMDAGYPTRGDRRDGAMVRAAAWTLSRLVGADCTRRPWRLLERDTHDTTTEQFTLRWVVAAAGTAT